MALARTNLTLPEELIREVDAIAGPRGRSRYVAEAVAQRVKRDRLRRAIEASFGSLVPKGGHPMTREEVSALVEELRSEVSD
jgi:metal-responsive CopG/Arc/MetJ family transcriptional regulator